MIGAGADVGAKNDRGEKPVDLVTNESVLVLLVSAAQELDKREEEEVRHWSISTSSRCHWYNIFVSLFLTFSPGCLACTVSCDRFILAATRPLSLISMIGMRLSGELQGLVWCRYQLCFTARKRLPP